MMRAARLAAEAADRIGGSAETIREAAQRLAQMFENGYGGAGQRLVERLDEQSDTSALLKENDALRAEVRSHEYRWAQEERAADAIDALRTQKAQLLEALEQVESLLGGLADKEFENQHAANKSATACDLARAAIAAARGES